MQDDLAVTLYIIRKYGKNCHFFFVEGKSGKGKGKKNGDRQRRCLVVPVPAFRKGKRKERMGGRKALFNIQRLTPSAFNSPSVPLFLPCSRNWRGGICCGPVSELPVIIAPPTFHSCVRGQGTTISTQICSSMISNATDHCCIPNIGNIYGSI